MCFLIDCSKNPPDYFYKYFKENNVKHIVRLNGKRTYDAENTFVKVANINHVDLGFEDGTSPPDNILNEFFNTCDQYIDDGYDDQCSNNEMCESNANNTNFNNSNKLGSAVAIHCKGKFDISNLI